jgi:hypothetical protein
LNEKRVIEEFARRVPSLWESGFSDNGKSRKQSLRGVGKGKAKYEEDSSFCSVQLVDGQTSLFRNGTVARS